MLIKVKMDLMLNKYAPYILAVSLLIFGLALGFFIGKNMSPKNTVQNDQPAETINKDSLYSVQTASLMGLITKRDANNLTIRNSSTGAQGEVKASPRLVITKVGARNASTSSEMSSIELNKEVFINLEMIDGEYQVVSIQYPLPAPSLPPIPSPKTSPQVPTPQ